MTCYSTAAHKGIIWLRLLLLVLIVVPFMLTVNAQSASVTQIPLDAAATIAVSPDGTLVAAATNAVLLNDQVEPQYLPIQLIDLSTGKSIGQLTGASDYAGGLAFSPDGKTLATAHNNGVLNLWDIASKSIKTSFVIGPPTRGHLIAFLPARQQIVLNESVPVPTLTLWDTSSGAMVKYLTQHFDSYDQFGQLMNDQPLQDYVSAFAVSPDGTTIVAATAQDDIWRWNVADGSGTELVDSGSKIPYFDIRQISFTADGSSIYYFAQQQNELDGWNLATNSATTPVKLTATAAVVSPDGQTIASVQNKGDSVTFQPISGSGSPTEVKLPSGVPLTATLTFTADGKKLIVNGVSNGADHTQGSLNVVQTPSAS
ncbi:MAG TPA: hypothetical protein VHD90_21600 [Phototrophicaceae bacterium]|nr:hypothetical protein [Phototrophicaceae bacterium]